LPEYDTRFGDEVSAVHQEFELATRRTGQQADFQALLSPGARYLAFLEPTVKEFSPFGEKEPTNC
jgi:hypothetical protein